MAAMIAQMNSKFGPSKSEAKAIAKETPIEQSVNYVKPLSKIQK